MRQKRTVPATQFMMCGPMAAVSSPAFSGAFAPSFVCSLRSEWDFFPTHGQIALQHTYGCRLT